MAGGQIGGCRENERRVFDAKMYLKLPLADVERVRAVQVARRLESKSSAIRQLLRERLDELDAAEKAQPTA